MLQIRRPPRRPRDDEGNPAIPSFSLVTSFSLINTFSYQISPALFKVVDDLGNTALHYAAGSGKIDVVVVFFLSFCLNSLASILQFLLKHGQSPNAMNKRRETPLFKAAARGRADVIEMLMKAGANPELKNADGNSPIDIAGNDDCRTMLQPIRGCLFIIYIFYFKYSLLFFILFFSFYY